VITTDWNRSNTGLIAIEASRQLKFITGLDIVGVRSSNGSIIRTNPTNSIKFSSRNYSKMLLSANFMLHFYFLFVSFYYLPEN